MPIETENHSEPRADNGTNPRLVDGVADAAKKQATATRARLDDMMKRLSAAMARHPVAFAMAGLALGYGLARMRSRR